jgi:hypothetical protein
MARSDKKNLHVPLDEPLHERLLAQTQRVRSPVTRSGPGTSLATARSSVLVTSSTPSRNATTSRRRR